MKTEKVFLTNNVDKWKASKGEITKQMDKQKRDAALI